MTLDDMVIRRSVLPGCLVQYRRQHIAIEDPVEAGWMILNRKWYWVGLKTWWRINSHATFHIALPSEYHLIPDRAVTDIERNLKLRFVTYSLLHRNLLTSVDQ